MKKASFILLIVALICEVILSIPIIGGLIVVTSDYFALMIAFAIHASLLVLRIIIANKAGSTNKAMAAPVVGLVASVFGIIPIIGWMLHIASAIMYIVDLAAGKHNKVGT